MKIDDSILPKTLQRDLITRAAYDKLPPLAQGYAQYWEGAVKGSELRNLRNPYPIGSKERDQWDAGQLRACQHAQDGDY